MKTLVGFMKKNKPEKRISKLKNFKNEIFELFNQGFRVEQIQEFLAENEINSSARNIYYFLKNNSKEVKNFSLQTLSSDGTENNLGKEQEGEDDEINFKNFRKILENNKEKN